jgi:hypothetical protein
MNLADIDPCTLNTLEDADESNRNESYRDPEEK